MVKAAGRDAEVVAFEKAIIEFFVEAAELIGVPKSIAAIYGICFASNEPIGFVEIQERLNLSLGSISQGLRVLREIGALKVLGVSRNQHTALDISGTDIRAVIENRRSARYIPNLEARKLVAAWLDQRLSRQLAVGRKALKQILRAVPDVDGQSYDNVRDRVRHLDNWHRKTRMVMPAVRAILRAG